jgi:hypothetical protein
MRRRSGSWEKRDAARSEPKYGFDAARLAAREEAVVACCLHFAIGPGVFPFAGRVVGDFGQFGFGGEGWGGAEE